MHRQARQHGHRGVVQKASKCRGFRKRSAGRTRTGHQVDGLFPQQGEAGPGTMEELIHRDGVGRKTANVVLGNAFGVNVGVVVDTHVTRLSQRLGLTKQKQPEKIEEDLMKLVPREQWTLLSHWLIWHGRRRCSARKPDCAGCELRSLCPTGSAMGG